MYYIFQDLVLVLKWLIRAVLLDVQLDLLKGPQEVFIVKKIVHIQLKHFVLKDSIYIYYVDFKR